MDMAKVHRVEGATIEANQHLQALELLALTNFTTAINNILLGCQTLKTNRTACMQLIR